MFFTINFLADKGRRLEVFLFGFGFFVVGCFVCLFFTDCLKEME